MSGCIPAINPGLSIPDLIQIVKHSFRECEFDEVQNILIDREKKMKIEIENLQIDRDSVKESEKLKLEEKLRRKCKALNDTITSLDTRVVKMGLEIEDLRQEKEELKRQNHEATKSLDERVVKMGQEIENLRQVNEELNRQNFEATKCLDERVVKIGQEIEDLRQENEEVKRQNLEATKFDAAAKGKNMDTGSGDRNLVHSSTKDDGTNTARSSPGSQSGKSHSPLVEPHVSAVYQRRQPMASNKRQRSEAVEQQEYDLPPPEISVQQHEEDEGYDDDPTEEGVEDYGLQTPSLLRTFDTHVAAAIWRGEERTILKCRSHTSKLLAWDYESDASNRAWRSLFKRTGLWRMRHVSYKNTNKNLITAFVERWHPETNTFHMPFGEMTITLDDVFCLTGLPIHGLPVQSTRTYALRGTREIMRLFGVSLTEAMEALDGARGSSVRLEWLREKFMQLITSDDDKQIVYAARAYVMYTFGCSIFSDKSGTRVSTAWLEFLEDMSTVHTYAWGAATLAYLYRQLGLASRTKVKQVAGYLTLLEAWIYEHFPGLARPPHNIEYRSSHPLAMRWSPEGHGGPALSRVHALRERMDVTTSIDVIWSPYSVVRDTFPLNPVTFFHGCIGVVDIVEPYMPDRVLRQYGYVQTIPEMPLAIGLVRSGESSQRYKLAWSALAAYFASWDSHILSKERLGRFASPPWECDDCYLEWFHSNSHPVVQNPAFRSSYIETPAPFASDPSERIGTTHSLIRPIVQRWRTGDRTISIDEVMKVLDATYTTLEGTDPLGPSTSRGSRHRR